MTIRCQGNFGENQNLLYKTELPLILSGAIRKWLHTTCFPEQNKSDSTKNGNTTLKGKVYSQDVFISDVESRILGYVDGERFTRRL